MSHSCAACHKYLPLLKIDGMELHFSQLAASARRRHTLVFIVSLPSSMFEWKLRFLLTFRVALCKYWWMYHQEQLKDHPPTGYLNNVFFLICWLKIDTVQKCSFVECFSVYWTMYHLLENKCCHFISNLYLSRCIPLRSLISFSRETSSSRFHMKHKNINRTTKRTSYSIITGITMYITIHMNRYQQLPIE